MSPRMLFIPLLLVSIGTAHAFCGFYVAGGEAKLYNHRSQVALVRDGDRTVLTLASDYEGDPREFALVVPVPVVLKRGQIHVADSTLMGQLDAFSAPRLVEYFDEPPCREVMALKSRGGRGDGVAFMMASPMAERSRDEVRIEARYEVDE